MARKPTAIVTLSLRIREELRRRLEQGAKAHQHSMNIEIIKRLEASFDNEEREADRRATVKATLESLYGPFDELRVWVDDKGQTCWTALKKHSTPSEPPAVASEPPDNPDEKDKPTS